MYRFSLNNTFKNYFTRFFTFSLRSLQPKECPQNWCRSLVAGRHFTTCWDTEQTKSSCEFISMYNWSFYKGQKKERQKSLICFSKDQTLQKSAAIRKQQNWQNLPFPADWAEWKNLLFMHLFSYQITKITNKVSFDHKMEKKCDWKI